MEKTQVFNKRDVREFNAFGIKIHYYKNLERSKFNKKIFLSNKTLRCKLLYIISLIFNLQITVPEFEWRARGCDKYGENR